MSGIAYPTLCSAQLYYLTSFSIPAGSPSRGGDVTVYVKDINQPSSPTPYYFVLVSVSVFMALSTVFHSIILTTILRFVTLFFRSYLCLLGPSNYLSLSEGLLEPRYNP